ncbi:hypothetical protein AMD24_00810 [Candidatus Xiphinematobacter sp. Idaho Grape]|uniref:hypothetical protein n=1 Tax=Candidatus Xiphinematobacter sp. Idaho Grape TaxID=1704307 RepID=UPI000706AADC|nr:hypothetical protein [Candidatus Xiphinematobacter sp. Idaho Grape]ALJ56967.1 hypothetical protein AMD24_00810 [Candidatus Xiphinematobacter sp. Idaho Grape]
MYRVGLISITEKTMHAGIACFAMRTRAHLPKFIGWKEWLSMVYSTTKWPLPPSRTTLPGRAQSPSLAPRAMFQEVFLSLS